MIIVLLLHVTAGLSDSLKYIRLEDSGILAAQWTLGSNVSSARWVFFGVSSKSPCWRPLLRHRDISTTVSSEYHKKLRYRREHSASNFGTNRKLTMWLLISD